MCLVFELWMNMLYLDNNNSNNIYNNNNNPNNNINNNMLKIIMKCAPAILIFEQMLDSFNSS